MDYVIHARNHFGLGDITMLTALARDIKALHPNVKLGAETLFPHLWKNNPHIKPVNQLKNPKVIQIQYAEGIVNAKRGSNEHFLKTFYDNWKQQTKMEVYPRFPKGDIHLSALEREPKISGKYWVVLAGCKKDMTAKMWDHKKWQALVDRLLKDKIRCVQIGGTNSDHFQPRLNNVLDLIGKTEDWRDMLSVIYRAEGVICGVTSAMHMAACFDKPCVVIAGGREDTFFVHYTNEYRSFGPHCASVKVPHRFIHTIGKLDCCATKGCWKRRTYAIDSKDLTYKSQGDLCSRIVKHQDESIWPKCMDIISVDQVYDAVMSYYKDGTLGVIKELPRVWVSPFGLAVDFPTKPKGQEEELAVVGEFNQPLRESRLKEIPKLLIPDGNVQTQYRQSPPSGIQHPIYDNPIIGGKFTVFVLCYGDYTELAKSCLTSILNNSLLDRIELRVACNQVSRSTLEFLEDLPIQRLYVYEENRRKYPVMREIFNDPSNPITTPYLLWFDDDTNVVDDTRWLEKLGAMIINNHRFGSRLYGQKAWHDLMIYAKNGHRPELWFHNRPWWTGKHFRTKGQRQTAPNGSCIDFVPGWFWAMATHLINDADIPDPILYHNGGDITIGAQVIQAGYKVCSFNQNKEVVFTAKNNRRGYSENFPWAKPTPVQAVS